MIRRRWMWVAAASLPLVIGGCGAATATSGAGNMSMPQVQSASSAPAPLPGRMAPDFALQTLDGTGTVHLQQLLGKKPILLNVWASWCENCRAEMPDLVKTANQYADKVQFIGVDLLQQDQMKDIKAFLKQYHVTYRILLDTDGSFENNYNIQGIPMTFLISPQGKILNVHVGTMKASDLTSLMKQALASS